MESMLAAEPVEMIAAGGMLVLALAVMLAYVGLVIAAGIGVLTSSLRVGMKVLWILILIAAPFVGSLLWFVVGRNHVRCDRPAA